MINSDKRTRKLRPLVISMGGERETQIRSLFEQMKDHFEEPVFSPGVHARSLRSRSKFFPIAHEAGLVSDAEWNALRLNLEENSEAALDTTDKFYECLKDVPIIGNRKGSEHDVKLHYCVELWRKAKGLNRGRSVFACTLAHLIAMKKCVEEGFDFILEDNVRAPIEQCAERIHEAIQASECLVGETGEPCHLRYFGWLGSIPNLKWVLNTHSKRMSYNRKHVEVASCIDHSVFPFPISQDFDAIVDMPGEDDDDSQVDNKGPATAHQKPGGTAIWGAYAYWISSEGYQSLLACLQRDVGAMLWKGKRMRCHVVKPVDKVMPRQIIASFGRQCIHVATSPAFFRAPMLTSKIHAKWDPEFCKSTEYQLGYTNLCWNDLWLAPTEWMIVRYHQTNGEWITTGKLLQIQGKQETLD